MIILEMSWCPQTFLWMQLLMVTPMMSMIEENTYLTSVTHLLPVLHMVMIHLHTLHRIFLTLLQVLPPKVGNMMSCFRNCTVQDLVMINMITYFTPYIRNNNTRWATCNLCKRHKPKQTFICKWCQKPKQTYTPCKSCFSKCIYLVVQDTGVEVVSEDGDNKEMIRADLVEVTCNTPFLPHE